MKPKDCLPQDRYAYFNGGWVLVDGAICRLTVCEDGEELIAQPRSGNAFRAELEDIYPFYPEGGCINTYDVGICVARRARQCRRRTASTQHYDVVWTPHQRRLTLDRRIMWDLCDRPKYPTYTKAMQLLDTVASVALSNNIILHRVSEEDINVLWHMHPAGRIQGGLFVPDYEDSCFTKLARMELQELDASSL